MQLVLTWLNGYRSIHCRASSSREDHLYSIVVVVEEREILDLPFCNVSIGKDRVARIGVSTGEDHMLVKEGMDQLCQSIQKLVFDLSLGDRDVSLSHTQVFVSGQVHFRNCQVGKAFG